jgi:hypothetical protein
MVTIFSSNDSCRRYRLTNSFVLPFGIFGMLWINLKLHRSALVDVHSFKFEPDRTSSQAAAARITISNSNHRSVETKHTPSRLAIFYNIFINPNNVSHSVRIIKNQTNQMARIRRHSNTPIYYNIIGFNFTDIFCPGTLQCKFLNYYPQAGEDTTLNDLHQYCLQHQAHQVIYIHNKGSFSPNNRNEIKRRLVTSVLVRLPPLPPSATACNVQTLFWEPLPHFHAQSNMWLAKCSYVANLISPKEFEQRRVAMFHQLLKRGGPEENGGGNDNSNRKKYRCLASVFNRSISDIYQQEGGLIRAVGMGRFSHELWIYSHPDIQPCDRDYTLGKALLERPDALSRRFQHAWFRQQGRLFEFQHLYHQLPPTNASFFWNYYENATQPSQPKACRPPKPSNSMRSS